MTQTKALIGLTLVATVVLANTSSAKIDTVITVPGRVSLTPWVASEGATVAVSFAARVPGSDGDVFVAVSRDGGQRFDAPVMVNTTPGDARISGEIAPRVALRSVPGKPLEVVVWWNARAGGTAIRVAKSIDGGKSFGAPTTLQTAGALGDRGWHAGAIGGNGALHAIWLDHRSLAADKGAGGHKGEHDGVAMAQKSSLYYSDGTTEREVFKGVCYCCKTAMATGPKGEIFAAWRHVFAGNFRDMAFTVSRDGGRTFAPLTRVNEDGWSIAGCPDDGPAMAVDATGMVHLVWPTVLGGAEGAIMYATSRDGRAFSKPVRVPGLGAPKPSHPQIMLTSTGAPIVAWDESAAGVRTAAFRRGAVAADGSVTFGSADVLGPAAYPILAAVPGGVFAAWTSGPPDTSVIATRVIK